MPTDPAAAAPDGAAFDVGLLAPVAAGTADELADARFADALVTAEAALVRAWGAAGVAPAETVSAVSAALGWRAAGEPCAPGDLPIGRLVSEAVGGGNPVIPLVAVLKERVAEPHRRWVHRGATSQDVLDTALMLLAKRSATALLADLRDTAERLAEFARAHRDEPAAARTLTQHAVPTTVGARATGWLRGVRRAADGLERITAELPAQLAGAGGTLASFASIGGDAAPALPARFAAELGLAAPEGPWHTVRWPVTELGDALVRATDALGVIAADVATLSRTEVGELAEGAGGGSSAMPQKRNPARSVLIRSAAIRAPHLAATLHAAAALAVDERPDGAWHAEWPALRELLRTARGAAARAVELVSGLRVDPAAVQRNLHLTGGLIVAERLSIELAPRIGADRLREIVAAAGAGGDLAELLRAEPALAGIDIDAILDPAGYTGLAARIVDAALAEGAGADPDVTAADPDPDPRTEEPA
ncbi:lyase family protein [Leucobacter allii]|uniref:lyase family protein n=1 Tax=Leucobacter allii TaxID=2932247 RepID=UPI001FD5924B|nr:lyase family protein [Leucobacter allii]UOR01892.1 lyase family protein [Leucobacter allii]